LPDESSICRPTDQATSTSRVIRKSQEEATHEDPVRAWGRISIITYKQKLKWIITGKNLETAVKTVASSFAYRHVKEHRPGKSVFPTALILAMGGRNG